MRIIFAFNHPAHYHLFKNTYNYLKDKSHNVVFVIRDKDILKDLLESENVPYTVIARERRAKSRIGIIMKGILNLLSQDISLFLFVKKFKPDLMVGTDFGITHVGKLCNIPAIVFNEDDYEINKIFCSLAYPFADSIVSPLICNVGKYSVKKISYSGYQKLAYLHPQVFTPDEKIVQKYIQGSEKYILLRLVSFSAGHDIEMKHGGIDKKTLRKLLNILIPCARVYISSESPLCDDLKPYKLNIDVKEIHHLMAFASLFIADSQSMIVEACMLGVPSIRYNSFVGKISVLEELEKKYKLTTGISNNDPDSLLTIAKQMIENKNLSNQYKARKDLMLKDKINVSAFFSWFIENYPESKLKIKSDPSYSNQFK